MEKAWYFSWVLWSLLLSSTIQFFVTLFPEKNKNVAKTGESFTYELLVEIKVRKKCKCEFIVVRLIQNVCKFAGWVFFKNVFTSDYFLFAVNLTEIAIILDSIHFTKRVIE